MKHLIQYNGHFVNNSNRYIINYGIDVPPIPPSITAGWTIATNGEARPTLDPNPGASKNPYETTTQIDGDYTSSYYPTQAWGANDQFNMYCPSAGIWNITLNNWQDFTSNYMRQDFGAGTTATVTGLITMDFFGKQLFGNRNNQSEETMYRCMSKITYIPSATSALFNADNLTNISYAFKNCTNITGEIIPFITAIQSLRPTVSHTQTFNNCTAASDWAQVQQNYSDWI